MALAFPVVPEAPEFPEVAVPLACGLDVALPVFPPVDVDVALESPELPEVAVPVVVDLAAPELPPVAVPSAAPELPEVACISTPPEPPPP